MKFGIMYKQGEIVILPFPFTDLSSVKQRPVLIISNDEYNQKKDDFVVCGITSNVQDTLYSVPIDNFSLSEGIIPVSSRIKADKLFTLKQSLVRKKVARVKEAVLEKVKEEIKKLMGNKTN